MRPPLEPPQLLDLYLARFKGLFYREEAKESFEVVSQCSYQN